MKKGFVSCGVCFELDDGDNIFGTTDYGGVSKCDDYSLEAGVIIFACMDVYWGDVLFRLILVKGCLTEGLSKNRGFLVDKTFYNSGSISFSLLLTIVSEVDFSIASSTAAYSKHYSP